MTRRDRRIATLVLIAVVAVALGLGLTGGWRTEAPQSSPTPSGEVWTPGVSAASSSSSANATAPGPTGSEPAPGLTLTWTRVALGGLMPGARQGHTWTVDPDSGIAYLYGGSSAPDGSQGSPLGDLWSYDLAADAWQPVLVTGSAPPARSGHIAAWVDGVGLVIAGGRDAEGGTLDEPWRFDPETSSWQRLPTEGPPVPARSDSCAALDRGGRLWLMDGTGSAGTTYTDTWRYEPGAPRWELVELRDPPPARAGHVCWFDASGRLQVFGGTDGDATLGDLWAVDVQATPLGAWRQQPLDGSFPARSSAALAIDAERVVIVGGLDAQSAVLADAGVVSDRRDTIEPVVAAGQAFPGSARAALIDDPAGERLLLFGGVTPTGVSNEIWQAILR
jgi:hypothetical protein